MGQKTNQQKAIFYPIYVVIIFLIQSCATVYTSSSYGSLKSYTAKPAYRSKDTCATYVSGSISVGEHDRGGENNDDKFLMSMAVYQSKTKRSYNYYYGIGLGYGTHTFNLEDLKGTYNLFNVNAKAGINLNIPTRRMDWRILGWELGYVYEFGPYQEKLADIKREQLDALVFNERSIWFYNFYSEAVFKFESGNALGVVFFGGDILNNSGELKNHDASFFGIQFSYTIKNINLNLTSEYGADVITSTKFGIAYQLK